MMKTTRGVMKAKLPQWQPGYAGENYYLGEGGRWWRKKMIVGGNAERCMRVAAT